MAQGFSVETTESHNSIILMYGCSHPFMNSLMNQFAETFSIVCISEKESTSERIHTINKSSVYLLDKMVESIDYALIYLETAEDKRIISLLSEKFKKDDTKALILFASEKLSLFQDTILEFNTHPSFTFLLVGDIFGSSIFPSSPLKKIVKETIETKSVTLTGNDLEPIFPISEEDAQLGVNSCLFGVRSRVKVGYLFYEQPQTIISAVHLLRRVEPDIQIKYQENAPTSFRTSHEEVSSVLKQKIGVSGQFLKLEYKGFEKSIEELLTQKERVDLTDPSTPLTPSTIIKKLKVKKRGDSILFPLLLGLTIFLLFSFSLVMGILGLSTSTIHSLKSGNIASAIQSAKQTRQLLSFINPSIKLLADSIPEGDIHTNLTTLLNLEEIGSQKSLTDLSLKSLSQGLSKNELDHLLSDSIFSFFLLQQSKTDLASLSQKNCAFCILSASQLSQIINPTTSKLVSLFPIAPQLLGYTGEKNYLILFQNNGELRPTGGFIGSIGELSLINGKIDKLTIQDVYEPDGQLKTHIEPHYIIRKYLQPHLYLRDSNFSPSFEQSASMSALLYNLETGKKVDGVIAIDFEVLKRIIHLLGPIKLPTYNKTLTDENTFSFLQDTIEKNFFPGSTEKKDVLNSLFTQLTLKLEQNPTLFWKVVSELPILLEQKHILIAVQDLSLQSLLTASGFSGNFFDPRVSTPRTLSDTFSLNEANIGVNKSNYTLSREVNLDVTLSDQAITTRAQIIITNTDAQSKDYKSYMRLLIPSGTTIQSLAIDGKKQEIVPAVTDFHKYELPVYKAPAGLEVDSTLEGNLHSYGFVITVPKGASQMVEVSYTRERTTPLPPLFDYSLLYFTQPGTTAYPLTVSLHYPSSFSPKNSNSASFEDGKITFSQSISSDFEFKAAFLKK